ncbi:EpsG family protein [Chryseobacterium sp. RLHN22]|uniref:EpsG family protein n=1 Tax=Chryseobacterium sp. RLHN22 TaxID=3437885 RepID=UPI003D9B76AE
MILLIIFLLILSVCLLSFFNYKISKVLLFPVLVGLTFILFFKYGQGVDYFNYLYAIKDSANSIDNFLSGFGYINRFEIGFSVINYILLYYINLNVSEIISVYSVIIFVLFILSINKYSKNVAISFIFFFSFYFFIYNFSAIRQGLALSILMYFVFPYFIKKSYIKFIIGILLLSTIHTSSLILISLLFLHKINLNNNNIGKYVIICIPLGIFVIPLIITYMGNFIAGVNSYVTNYQIDFVSLGVRLIMFLIIYFFSLSNKRFLGENDNILIKIYYISFLMYILLLTNSLISSRLTIYFRVFEFIVLSNLIVLSVKRKQKTIIVSIFLIISLNTIMYFKSVNTEITLGEYKNVNVFNFPIILDESEIYQYRDSNIDLENL